MIRSNHLIQIIQSKKELRSLEGSESKSNDVIKPNNENIEKISKEISNSENKLKEIQEEIIKNSDIDILINNAGITGPTATLWEYDIEMWKKVVDINLMGTFNCCRAIVPSMISNNYGRIVNVASVAGKDGNANASAYSAGKAGAIGLTKSLGKELADKNIAVNAVTSAGTRARQSPPVPRSQRRGPMCRRPSTIIMIHSTNAVMLNTLNNSFFEFFI